MAICFVSRNGNIAGHRRFYGGKIIKAVSVREGKIVEFIYPEKIVVKEGENLKANKIPWKLHTK